MRTLHSLAGVLGVLFSCSAFAAAPTAPTQQQIDASKAAAAAASVQMQGQALQVDANGQPVLDSNGRPQLQASSSNSLRDSMRLFQSYTGLQGMEQKSAPGNAGAAGVVSLKVSNTFDFTCSAKTKGQYSAGSLSFLLNGCDPAKGVTLQTCDKGLQGGTCSQSSDYSAAAVLAPGAFSTISGLDVGLGCNSTGACRVTVNGTHTMGGNDDSLKQQAQAAAQSADGSALSTDLRNAVVKGDYAGKVKEYGVPLQACAKLNENAATTGVVQSCDGTQQVTMATTQSQAKCTGPKTCLKEAVTSQTFTKSCTRTFPLTERISHYQFADTATCQLTRATVNGASQVTDSCAPTTDGDPRQGKTQVGRTGESCSSTVKDENGVETCVAYSWTEYWANVGAGKLLSQSASPSAVTGACDTNPYSETRTNTCENGNWFGRTLGSSECSVEMVNEATGSGVGIVAEISYAEKAGCGFCLTPQVGETCYGAPSATDEADSCAGAGVDACTLSSVTPRNYTGSGGLVSSQEEQYTCKTETTTCVQWSQGGGDNNCQTYDTLGLEKVKSPAQSSAALNNAMVAAAMVDSTAQGVEGSQASSVVPKIFTGTDMRCKRATGGIGTLLGRNCCRTDIERPIGRTLTRAGCNLDDARLAAARRSHYAVYIGDYCSRQMRFPRKCLERTETYCVFPGILPRLVHEQGRVQLATIAASSASPDIQRMSLTFPYYDTTEAGHWSAEALVNGVRVHAWQWPSYCANPETAGQKLLNDPTAKDCPGVVTTWVAACDVPAGCGDLPDDPSIGSGTWVLHELNSLENVTTAISKYSVATGACSTKTQNCAYTVSAWPAGAGGKAIMSRDLTWPLYSNQPIGSGAPSAQTYQMNNIADLMFKGYSIPGMATNDLPATVRLDFSRDGGQNWTTHQIPTDLKAGETKLPNSDVTVRGYCDVLTNSCGYRLTGSTVVYAKPWGSAKSPDCSGFSAGQLSAMDFGRMDLSEWLSSVMSKVGGGVNGTDMVAAASKQFQEYNSVVNGGGTLTTTQAAPRSANFARAVPSEGFGPFDVKLVVSAFWPETTLDPALDVDRVTSVSVDWGDCSVSEVVPAVSPNQGTGFAAAHRFEAPDSFGCLGNPQHNVTHNIKLTVYTTKSGVKTRVVAVENAWATFPGGHKNNDYVGTTVTVPATNGTPAPPKP